MRPSSKATEERIKFLRTKIAENPKRAKAISRLSQLLSEQAKGIPEDDNNETQKMKKSMEQEAFQLAQTSIQIAPNKAFGFGALSVCTSVDFKGRMVALENAVELESGSNNTTNASSAIGLTVSLVRLLVEPREHEAKTEGFKIARTSTRHPLRRNLDEMEYRLYHERIRKMQESAAGMSRLTNEEDEKGFWIEFDSHDESNMVSNNKKNKMQHIFYLAKTHYRLGIFFRKMFPEKIHKPNSQWHFEQVMSLLPSFHPISKKSSFWLATLVGHLPSHSGEGKDNKNIATVIEIDRCPEEYIVSLYSTFASKFDELLVNKLNYETPILLRKLLDKVQRASTSSSSQNKEEKWAKNCADLGCGTGLSGIAFQSCVIGEMIGVDLSPEMLEKAKDKKCYSELVLGDVNVIFHQQKDLFKCNELARKTFDLIISCDVFVYIGDLSSIFNAVQCNLSPRGGGYFAFSTECLDESASERPFILQPCARFAHKQSYIESLAKEVGMKVEVIRQSVIRKNEGRDVIGILTILSLP